MIVFIPSTTPVNVGARTSAPDEILHTPLTPLETPVSTSRNRTAVGLHPKASCDGGVVRHPEVSCDCHRMTPRGVV